MSAGFLVDLEGRIRLLGIANQQIARQGPRFVSLGEGWRNADQIDVAQSTPRFQDAMASIWRVLDSGEVANLDLIASVS